MNLNSPITKLPLVGPAYAKRLEKLSIYTLHDLLDHPPVRYLDFRKISPIKNLRVGDTVTAKGTITSVFNKHTNSGRLMTMCEIEDTSGKILSVWFNQPYLINSLKKGSEIAVAGTVEFFARKPAFFAPEYEIAHSGVHTGRLVPIYHETAGVSSKWLRSKILKAWNIIGFDVDEIFDSSILTDYHLTNLLDAYKFIHFPEDEDQIAQAKDRLAFNEMLFLHLKSLRRKENWQKRKPAFDLKIDRKKITEFENSLPFTLTISQKRSIKEIFSDLTEKTPMNRLLEGDVGSGKTLVAAAALYVSFLNGYTSILMAPTQILAIQHFETLEKVFKPFNITLTLITGEGMKGEKKADIYIGTHALLHKNLDLTKAALIIIDEQHRFGVEQREHFARVDSSHTYTPHTLTMTATPIPRTVALTLYGDLTLSTLNELPPGRIPITTWVVPKEKRAGAYEWIKKEIDDKGIQVYVICPLIEESEKDGMQQVKAATVEFENLKKIFKGKKLGLLHGRLKASEKEKLLADFRNAHIDILVSTPVIEVGIDVANATIMMIEGAERFGLAQLHQLRGRVGRGSIASYCLLMTESTSPTVTSRLTAMKSAKSGFELAEIDLKMRGPGQIYGTSQSGFFDLKIAEWNDLELINKTRKLAEIIVKNPKKYKKVFEFGKLEREILN